MIRIITRDNIEDRKDILEECFRLRYQIFIEEFGWKHSDCAHGLETDQFDTDDAVHIAAIDNEKVIGYSRLLRSTKPHLLNDVFSHLATRTSVPTGPHIYEWTRYCVARSHRGGSAVSKTASELICGVLEYCEDNHIHTLTAVYEAVWITRFLELGFDVIPLGIPQLKDGYMIVGVRMDILTETLKTTRSIRSIEAKTVGDFQGQQL